MYQFFVKSHQIVGKEITIINQDVNHIKNVLRMKIEDEIAVSNGIDSKEYRCRIKEFKEESILCEICFIKEDGVELPSEIYLFQGLPKSDKMELIIQKVVELGVFEIIPVATKRAVVKLDEKKAKSKTIRWQGIAEAAAKQSKRRIIPKVREVMTFSDALEYAQEKDLILMPYELAEGMATTKKMIEGIQHGKSVAIFIGPEGGFTEVEVNKAIGSGACPITLGKRILRTETAGFTILAWIMYHLEDG